MMTMMWPNDCSNTYHYDVVFVNDDDNNNDDDDDDDDNDNCGNGGGSVGCRGGDDYFKTEDYLYNDDIKKMLPKLGIRRSIC